MSFACHLFTCSRGILAAHADPSASPQLRLGEGGGADASVDVGESVSGDDDASGWGGALSGSGHALLQQRLRNRRRESSSGAPKRQPMARARIHCRGAP